MPKPAAHHISRHRLSTHRPTSTHRRLRRTRAEHTTPSDNMPITPAVAPVRDAILPGDRYVHLDGNRYSVPSSASGRPVELVADGETISILQSGRVVAQHTRCRRRSRIITDCADQPRARARRTS